MKKINALLNFCFSVLLVTSLAHKSEAATGLELLSPGSAENLIIDTEYVNDMANVLLEEVEHNIGEKPSMESLSEMKKKIRQASYVVAQSKAFSEAKLKAAFLKYPDVFIFRMGVEVASIALIPVLIYFGHKAWIIPIHAPGVGTTSTTIYLLTRKWFERRSLTKRFKMSPKKLEEFKLELFSNEAYASVNPHLISDGEGGTWLTPIARQKITTKITDYIANTNHEYGLPTNVIMISELENMINNPDFINSARVLHIEEAQYERLLITKIMSEPELKKTYLERAESLSVKQQDPWGSWIIATEISIARIRSEALETLEKRKLFKMSYIKSLMTSKESRQELYSQIQDAVADRKEAQALYQDITQADDNKDANAFKRAKAALGRALKRNMIYPGDLREILASRADHKDVYNQIQDLELFQLDSLSAYLRGENVDLQAVEIEFESRRQEILGLSDAYRKAYPKVEAHVEVAPKTPKVKLVQAWFKNLVKKSQSRPVISCEDLFAAGI